MIKNFNELFAELKAKGICKKMIAAWGVDSHTIEAASLASDQGFVRLSLRPSAWSMTVREMSL